MMKNRVRAILISLACMAIAAADTANSQYGHWDDLRTQAAAADNGGLRLAGNLEWDATNRIGYCHLQGYLAFSRAADTTCNVKQAQKIYRELAAMYMAIHHFNTGNGVVVPEIQNINQKCPIRLSADLVDSKYTPAIVVQSLTQVLSDAESRPLCGVVGARTSSATGPGAVVSGVYEKPHMSYTATSPELNDAFRYPLFSRVVTSDAAAARAALRHLTEVQGSTHVAVLYTNDPFGVEYNKAFLQHALHLNVTAQSFPLDFPPNEENIQQAIYNVKETGYRHISLIVFSSYIEQVMLAAQAQGMTGPDYAYLLGISTSFFDDAKYPAQLANAFQGMAVLPEFGAKPRTAGYDRFVQYAWNQIQPDQVEYLNTKLPVIAGAPGAECFQAEPDFFTVQNADAPGDTAPFAYDTVISMGLGACAAWNKQQEQLVVSAAERPILDGKQHAANIVQDVRFEGATGFIQMDPQIRARDPLSFSYAVLNVQPKEAKDENGEPVIGFTTPESYFIRPNEDRTNWVVEQTGDFYYNGGSTIPPASLPELEFEYNQIGQWRILGWVLCGIIFVASASLALWSWICRKSRAVTLSQPPFLIMICVGTFIIGSMLIPLGIDDEYFDEDATDAACMAQPWLASIGFVTVFSALFSKTSRINTIMKNANRFKTIKVTEKDVLMPFFVLMTANVGILLCWTLLDPIRFIRTLDDGSDAWNRPVSSTGRCRSESDNGAAPYLACLAAVNLGAVILANLQAYKGRDLSDDMSESKYVGLIMMCLLQTWLTGGPVLFLVYDSPVSNYVVVTMICFLTCTAVLALIFIPKIILWRQWKTGQIDRNAITITSGHHRKRGSNILRGSSISGLNRNHNFSNDMDSRLGASHSSHSESKARIFASIEESHMLDEAKEQPPPAIVRETASELDRDTGSLTLNGKDSAIGKQFASGIVLNGDCDLNDVNMNDIVRLTRANPDNTSPEESKRPEQPVVDGS